MAALLQFLPNRFREARIAKLVQPYTLIGRERIHSLYDLARRIDLEGIPGDVVECGVCNGGSAAILAHFATRSTLNRNVWLLDSFEGMPETTAVDGEAAKAYVGQVVGNVAKVREILRQVNADLGRVRIVPGWFENTFPTVSIARIALLNIDADWYESVKACLERFYDVVSPGGFISFDDYGHWPGCRQAVHDFFGQKDIDPDLHIVDDTARWMRKI